MIGNGSIAIRSSGSSLLQPMLRYRVPGIMRFPPLLLGPWTAVDDRAHGSGLHPGPGQHRPTNGDLPGRLIGYHDHGAKMFRTTGTDVHEGRAICMAGVLATVEPGGPPRVRRGRRQPRRADRLLLRRRTDPCEPRQDGSERQRALASTTGRRVHRCRNRVGGGRPARSRQIRAVHRRERRRLQRPLRHEPAAPTRRRRWGGRW